MRGKRNAFFPSPLVGEGGSARSAETDEGCWTELSGQVVWRNAALAHHPAKRSFARTLRREMTEAEHKLWQELRDRRLDRIKFRRQVPIGKYVADFACLEARLIVELDGSQHADSESDLERGAELKARGFRILRFWNDDILKDMSGVCDTIIAYVKDTSLQPWR
ncbi:endonuclease domain-containing protein [Mesorhizobium sp. CA7]|uniref:endonuclease domain-containing protein n=1 Tax=Mesorhizobium sp. CA7 TaxID=588501 RepID=UPI001CCF2171|nr:endonuclease domain-containing protein [Mesorhizobium sp. CA7]MBZ9815791.1 endonuclease domain-containing protein [Mesorhizobium sp. CA7]